MSTSIGASPLAANYPHGFAYGVAIQQMPILNSYGGKVFWLDSTTGDDGGPGTFQKPWATLTNHVTKASTGGYNQPMASRGDLIMVKSGHAETISSATALTMSVAGISVVGVGRGTLRPTFTLDTATTATINVTAANVSFTNCVFAANYAAVASLFTLTTAKSFGLYGCEFRDTSSILNFKYIVTTNATSNAADGLEVVGCKRFGAGATANTGLLNVAGTNDRFVVASNYFASAATTDGALAQIATGKVLTNAMLLSNLVNVTGSASSTGGILVTTDGSTNSGYIDGNRVQSADATTAILVTASSGFIFGLNYYTHTADKSGFLLPAADS